ncbi:MAG: hypothetical protein K9M45_05450 [Kiritimatiellales bacterium]|nr:hypothetical protein [Kiritimatiellales bacterium]
MVIRLIVAVLFFSIIPRPVSGAEEYRIFTDQQDRAIEARIINFDSRANLVEIERTDRRRVKVTPEIFSEKDQVFIRDWQLIKGFMSSSWFKIQADKKTAEEWDDMVGSQRAVKRNYEKIVYNVNLQNGSSVTLENIRFEYRIFFEQEQLAAGGQMTEKHCVGGDATIESIAARSKDGFVTKPIVIFDQSLSGGYDEYTSGAPTSQSGKLKGFWLKAYMKTESGEVAEREYCSPANLKEHYEWMAVEKLSNRESAPAPSSKRKKKKKK